MDNSPFRKLPVELRLEIFENVLYSTHETGVFECDEKGPKLPPWMTSDNRQASTAVCRQIRAETFPRFYGCTKVSFCPMTLNKYQPGFFRTANEVRQQMIWEYLGSTRRWVERLSDWLDHMGPEIRRGITTIAIHLGTWKEVWSSLDNALMMWVIEALANIVCFSRDSGTQICLCFLFQMPGWFAGSVAGDGDLSMPISDMVTAYEVLNRFIHEQKDYGGQHISRYFRPDREETLDRGYTMLRTLLDRLGEKVQEQLRL